MSCRRARVDIMTTPWTRAVLVAVLWIGAPIPAWGEEASPVELGGQLIHRMGCEGCHTTGIPAFSTLGRAGPDLRRIAAKTNRSWAFDFVSTPRKMRPTTWMPDFFDESDLDEVRAIVAYLWDVSRPTEFPAAPVGDADRGEASFHSAGCTACHVRDAAAGREDHPDPTRLQGPNLAHLGDKVNAGWLYAWLRDPKQYAPQTRMPDLRLSELAAADLTAFLMQGRAGERERATLRAFDADDVRAGREAIDLYGCYGCHQITGFEDRGKHAGEWTSAEGFEEHGLLGLPDFGLSEREASAIRAAISAASKEEPSGRQAALADGRKLVESYNCRGCHLVEGRGRAIGADIEDIGLLPPDLNGEGSRVNPAWLAAYLADPGTARLRSWLPTEMPTFGFSDEQVDVLVDYFAALEDRELAVAPESALNGRNIALGREAFDLMPCGSCHPSGAEAARELELDAASLAPPLEIASRRLRYEWIALWLADPQSWSPGTRMPTFFSPTDRGTPGSPFAGLIDEPSFAELRSRMQQHVDSGQELAAFLDDGPAVIDAIRDYVWSLKDAPGRGD